MIARPDSALVVVGHGSTRNADSSRPTRRIVDDLSARGVFREVVSGFWLETPALRDAIQLTTAAEVFVVPNFISEGYFTRTVIPREMGLTGRLTKRDGRTIKYCSPTGSHPGMTNLLRQRAAAFAEAPPAATSLVIVGHGTPRDPRSAEAIHRQVGLLRAAGAYAEVFPAFMEEAPRIADWATFCTQPHVVIVPFFIADGLHTVDDIPGQIGLPPARDSMGSHAELRGRRVYYSGAVGTDPAMAEIVLDQVAAFDAGA